MTRVIKLVPGDTSEYFSIAIPEPPYHKVQNVSRPEPYRNTETYAMAEISTQSSDNTLRYFSAFNMRLPIVRNESELPLEVIYQLSKRKRGEQADDLAQVNMTAQEAKADARRRLGNSDADEFVIKIGNQEVRIPAPREEKHRNDFYNFLWILSLFLERNKDLPRLKAFKKTLKQEFRTDLLRATETMLVDEEAEIQIGEQIIRFGWSDRYATNPRNASQAKAAAILEGLLKANYTEGQIARLIGIPIAREEQNGRIEITTFQSLEEILPNLPEMFRRFQILVHKPKEEALRILRSNTEN